MIESEIAIVGAGPAGLSAALFLGKNGIPCSLIDRSVFPRDKVCGDCLGGFVISVIRQLGQDTFNRFIAFDRKIEGKGVHFFSPSAKKISIPAIRLVDGRIPELALSTRYDFDNFLMDEVRRYKHVQIYSNVEIFKHKRENGRLVFSDRNDHQLLKTRMAVIATGSQSKIAADLSGYKIPKKHLAGGLRCYYEGVEGIAGEGYIEFHFLEELIPGYLWIFPLKNNLANVGIGQRSDVIARRGTDLKKLMPHVIASNPHLQRRFAKAKMVGRPEGFPLSLGMTRRRISGDNYLLAGDSASLIEPFFGEGIGNAMYSGKLAADHIMNCGVAGDFSAGVNRFYDRAVYAKIGRALALSRWLQRAAGNTWLLERVFDNTGKKPELRRLLEGAVNGDMAAHPGIGVEFIIRAIVGI